MQYGFVSQVTIATPRRQGRTSLTAPTTETRWKDAPGEGGGGEEGTGWRIGDGDGGVNVAKRVHLVLLTCLLFVSRVDISKQHTKIATSDDDSTKWQ